MKTNRQNSVLESEIKKLTELEESRSQTLSNIQALKTEHLNEKLQEVTPQIILQQSVELFSTQQNKLKLRSFLKDYEVIKIDLSYIDTGTYCCQVAFDQKKDFQSQLHQITPFLPFLLNIPSILSLPLKISGQHIKIKEYHLGDDGIYELVRPEFKNQVWLCRTKDKVSSIVKKFPSWETALEYVYSNHPYFK